MADNAIDKLFEEIRATSVELTAIQDEEEALQEQLRKLKMQHIEAIKRRDLLDVTLRKHIHTGMPVVQAKMQAHEEMGDREARDAGWTIQTTGTIGCSPMGFASQAQSQANAHIATIMTSHAKGYRSI
ncbi:MAG: hypothetical protein DI606_10495 [Sphingobium sp.]|uniref:hypothetical protein n=1 Tax=Sphingobium sp. TaxID=1912891 RepID=UPI000DAF8FDC|nr:hypothetical protein [Sphingobium sp.]PZU12101.1 MAG: hypothetical protein DI606_10495 [Sphingobium sp.]